MIEIPRNKIVKIYDENDFYRKYYMNESNMLIPVYKHDDVFIIENTDGTLQTYHINTNSEPLKANICYKIN
jgi:hypothetical protein